MRKSGLLTLVAVLLLGCGGEKEPAPAPGGGGEGPGSGAEAPAGAPVEAPTVSEKLAFPEKTLKEITPLLGKEDRLTDAKITGYIKYMKSMSELQSLGATDPTKLMAKMQGLHTECGFKSQEELQSASMEVANGVQMMGMMLSAETALGGSAKTTPATGALKDAYEKMVGGVKELAAKNKFTEADLRLVHKRLPDLEAIGRK